MFHVFSLRPWKRTYATGWVATACRATTFDARVIGVSRDTYASPVRSRNASVSSRSSGSIQERWRNSTSGTSGAIRSGTRSSSASASADFVKRGWYWSRTPRSFPESSSGSRAARNSAKASSVGSPSWNVIVLWAFDVERELGRRPLRPVAGHRGVREVVVGRVHLDRVEALGVVGEPRLRGRDAARIPGLEQALVGEAARPDPDRRRHRLQ